MLTERFWNKVNKKGPDDCWEWTASIRNGYGAFKLNGKVVDAHRIVWTFTKGSIPKEICVCHHCDNKLCVNPKHLFLGTKGDNNRDMFFKGRGKIPSPEFISKAMQGIGNPNCRLLPKEVLKIRELCDLGISSKILAKKYNVDPAHIRHIAQRRKWKHI